MKITDVIYITVIPALSFYGTVFDYEFSRHLLWAYVLIMLLISLVAIYFVDYTESGKNYANEYDMSESSYGTLKQKLGYALIISSACLLISYDHLLLGLFIIVPIFVNEYIADRIIDEGNK